jgi:predicted nucleotidyltransferase
VNPTDPNVQRVELVAAALGELRDKLVLVGGCAASLLIDTPTAPVPRVTFDVDLIAQAAALRDYHALERQFSQLGFARDLSPDAPICRWKIGSVKVDLMPTDESVLGFANRWYPLAAATARRLLLPSGTQINLISAPAFLATKFEAFLTRGGGDLLGSHDFEDIINVVEGCGTIESDMSCADAGVRTYLAARFADVMAAPDFENVLPGLMAYDALHEQRVQTIRRRVRTFATAPVISSG